MQSDEPSDQTGIEQKETRCPICNCKMTTGNKFCSMKCYNEFQSK